MTPRLRTPETSFVGRSNELKAIRERLTNARVLTLTGPGGIGKTRLAHALAADGRRVLDDGAVFVPLGGAGDDSHLTTFIGRALGISLLDDHSGVHEQVVEELKDNRMLLVLDNCEQVLDAVSALTDELARSCPGLRILATSRTPVTAGEQASYIVPPMTMPSLDDAGLTFDSSDAVRLFAERARAARPDFLLSDDTREDVRRIVRSLGGMPLAVELAAGQLDRLSLAELAEAAVQDRGVLAWQAPGLPSRHRSLHASLEWSSSLCTTPERHLWARLSIFEGPFTLDDAEAICSDADVPAEDVLDLVQRLLEQSVLVRHDHGAIVSYELSNLARSFGKKILGATEADQFRRRLASWYLSVRRPTDIPRDAAHRENLTAALAVAVADRHLADVAADAMSGLERDGWWSGEAALDGLGWVRELAPLVSDETRRAILLVLGSTLARETGDEQQSAHLLAAGSRAARRSGRMSALAALDRRRGQVALDQGDGQTALAHLRRALVRDEAGADARADTLALLVPAFAAIGDVEEAQATCDEALRALPAHAHRQRCTALLGLAEAYRSGGMTDRAWKTAAQASAELTDRDSLNAAHVLLLLAQVASDRRDLKGTAVLLGATGRVVAMLGESSGAQAWLAHEISIRRELRIATNSAEFASARRHGEGLAVGEAVAFAFTSPEPSRVEDRADECPLSAREERVAELVATGMTNREIATRLLIAQRTVDSHVQHVLTKLGVRSRTQIAAWFAARTASPAAHASGVVQLKAS